MQKWNFGKIIIRCFKKHWQKQNPGNDKITKEVYEAFWEDLKKLFSNVIDQANITKNLITTKQQNIKLVEKKDREKIHAKELENHLILNLDYKTVSKTFAARLKDIFPDLISS